MVRHIPLILMSVAMLIQAIRAEMWKNRALEGSRISIGCSGDRVTVQRLGPTYPPVIFQREIPTNGGFFIKSLDIKPWTRAEFEKHNTHP